MSDADATPQGPGDQPEEQIEELVIDDVETIRVLADPLRLRIQFELDEPKTVKELARALEIPQTRLYYHVKMLERAGLISVVARRTVSGIEERTYRTTAKSTTVSPALGGVLAETGAVRALLGMVAAELEIALQASPHVGEPDSSVIALNVGKVTLRPDEVEEFRDRLFGVAMQYMDRPDDDDADAVDFQLLVAAYRRPNAP